MRKDQWEDSTKALNQWLRIKDEISASQKPIVWDPDELTVGECFNLTIHAKRLRADSGDITERTFNEYVDAARIALLVLDREMPVKDVAAAQLR